MRSITSWKIAYAALSLVFTALLAIVVREALAQKADVGCLACKLLPRLGVVSILVAGAGWSVGRRLGLARGDAGAAALGSVIGGINVAVLVWILLRRFPADAESNP